MKKIIPIILTICMLATLLPGCAKEEESKVSTEDYDLSEEISDSTLLPYAEGHSKVTLFKVLGSVTVSRVIEAEDDVVTGITQESIYDASGLNDDDRQTLEDTAASAATACEEIECIKYKSTWAEGSLIETMEFDTTTPENIQTIIASGLITLNGNGETISLVQSMNDLIADGWTLDE